MRQNLYRNNSFPFLFNFPIFNFLTFEITFLICYEVNINLVLLLTPFFQDILLQLFHIFFYHANSGEQERFFRYVVQSIELYAIVCISEILI